MTDAHKFRVIVVGGGIAGLTASHTLQKAGIDHVVIEKGNDPAPAEGALEGLKATCTPVGRTRYRGPDGKVIVDSMYFDYVKENFGEEILIAERRGFLEVLYETLPDKSFLLNGRKVVDIVDDYEGVTVHLDDGSIQSGDMIIGCDGVHSTVRNLMWQNANLAVPGTISTSEKTSITTKWSCLLGVAPPNPGMGDGEMTCIHNDGFSFLISSQPDRIFFYIFSRIDDEFAWPQRRNYSDEDAEALASSVAGYPVSDSVVFGEIWRSRIRGGMVSLEEGILKHWYHGRTVLAGDAAHKVTPNLALGGNSSMESIVVLTNLLYTMLAEHKGAKPSRATLNRLFEQYQTERIPRMHSIMDYSSFVTKIQAWENPLLKFAATWIIPYAPDRFLADDISKNIVSTGSKLSFVPVSEGFGKGGKMQFADDVKAAKAAAAAAAAKKKEQRLVNGTASRNHAVFPLPLGMLNSTKKTLSSWAKKDGSSTGAGDSMKIASGMLMMFGAIYYVTLAG